MSYSARITTINPTAFVFMVDQSGSMEERMVFGKQEMSKAEAVAKVINKIIRQLVYRCRKEDGYRNYFDIAVLGYSGESVESLLPCAAPGRCFMSVNDMVNNVLEVQQVHKERKMPNGKTIITTVNENTWIKPQAYWKTPMYAAFAKAYELLEQWCKEHDNKVCFPPIVINITDGEATDATGDKLLAVSDMIKALSTYDGNVLLLNIHVSTLSKAAVLFPADENELPDERYARLLFMMSSVMPPFYQQEIGKLKGQINEQSRGVAYNADITDLIQMINIGSLTVDLLV